MAKNSTINMNLPSADDLFSTQEERDEATIIMVDSNLQREEILPLENPFAYKMKLGAMKRQGKRTDLTSTQVGQKLGKYSVEILGESLGGK